MYSKIIGFILLGVCFFSACNSKSGEQDSGELSISGKVLNPQEGHIILETFGRTAMEPFDTLKLGDDNSFNYNADKLSPGFYRLNFYGQQFVNIVLEDEPVQLTVAGNEPSGQLEFTGNSRNAKLKEIRDVVTEFQQEVNQLNGNFMQSGAAGDEQKMNELFNQVNQLQEKYGERLKEKISDLGINLAALQATTYLDPEKELNFVDSITSKVAEMYPENTMVSEYRQQISNLKQTAIGNKAPDIQLTNPEGEQVSLASLTGNYVLVDFWAAWCKPCRMENPNVVNAYQKYKDEGFQILGVSLDRNKEDWVEAIEKDNLTWHQVWDENNEAAIKYNVNAIPANFLLNPEGEIVAKNLRGEALQEKLAEIYN